MLRHTESACADVFSSQQDVAIALHHLEQAASCSIGAGFTRKTKRAPGRISFIEGRYELAAEALAATPFKTASVGRSKVNVRQ